VTLVDPAEPFRRQNEKLLTIAEALIRRVEHGGHAAGDAYLQFERAALLEEEVRQRTAELERTLDLLHRSNARLSEAMTEAEAARANVTDAIEAVEEGFGLFDADDLLVLHNSRFCSALGGVAGALEPGLPFERFIGLVSESPDLSLLGGQTAGEWATRRMRRHGAGRTTFNVPLTEDRWLQVSEQRTETGGTVILQTDITDTIRSERRERDRIIDRQARMVKATLDHIAQGVAIFDRRARLMGWNEKMNALVGHPLPGEMLGTSFERVLDGIDAVFTYGAAVDRAAFEAWAAQGHKRRPLSFEVERIGGRSFTVLAQEMPDRGFVVSLTDVTAERATARALRDMAASLERRVESRTNALGEALEEARRANASKTRFMAAASHDLLQPLSAAKLFAGTLEERSDTEEQREIAGKVVSALASVETIIDALLNISKLDSGRVEYKIAPVPLATLLSGLRDEMAPLAATRGVELRVVPSSLAVESDIQALDALRDWETAKRKRGYAPDTNHGR
jgi:signal transduction histidine kinase